MEKEKYSEILKEIWGKALPFLGEVTMEGIFRRLIKKREMEYPFLSGIILKEDGFNLSPIHSEDIERGMNAIILDFYSFLKEMTGSLITSEMEGLIKEVKNDGRL